MRSKTLFYSILVIVVAVIFFYFFSIRNTEKNETAAVPTITPQGSLSDLFSLKESFDSSRPDDLHHSIEEAQLYVDTHPHDVDAQLALAATYAQLGSIDFSEQKNGQKSIAYAKKALIKDPNNSEAYRIIGYAHEIMEQYPESITNYNKAIELDPHNAAAYSNRGHSYDLQGDLINARKDYEHALVIDELLDHALFNLARVDVREARYDDAEQHLQAVIDSTLNDRIKSEAMTTLASLLMFQYGSVRLQDAEDLLLETINLYPESHYALVQLGWIEYMKIDFDVMSENDINLRVQRILLLSNLATDLYPQSVAANHLVATTFFDIGDFERVVTVTSAVIDSGMIDNDITLGIMEKKSMTEKFTAMRTLATKLIETPISESVTTN